MSNVYFIKRRIHQKGSWNLIVVFINLILLWSPDKHKEVHRFDRNTFGWTIRGIELADELASSPLFPLADLERFNPAVIHYTPHYLYAPTVPFEMRRFYPHPEQLKFIVMLRDPVERAISSYWFQNSHIFKGVNKGLLNYSYRYKVIRILQVRRVIFLLQLKPK